MTLQPSGLRPPGARMPVRRPIRDAARRSSPACFAAIGLALALAVVCIGAPAQAGPYLPSGWNPIDMISWATSVESIVRGPLQYDQEAACLASAADPADCYASYGVAANVLGSATGDFADTLSLGDGGSIVLGFASGIGDGPGDDFAVFENGFFDLNGLFAELAFVEISTDGIDWVRLPSETVRTTPVFAFDSLDPTDYIGLAGLQPGGIGTGFDLYDALRDPLVVSGIVDLNDVRFVRLVDVIGDGSTTDTLGQPIYDPWATPFDVGGFDLEAVGVRHAAPEPATWPGLFAGVWWLVGLARGRRGAARPARCIA